MSEARSVGVYLPPIYRNGKLYNDYTRPSKLTRTFEGITWQQQDTKLLLSDNALSDTNTILWPCPFILA